MNPNCPDPNYPEWDQVAQGCRAALNAATYGSHEMLSAAASSLIFALAVLAASIIVVRWFNVR